MMGATLLTWAVLLLGRDGGRRAGPVGVEPSPDRRGEAARARDHRRDGPSTSSSRGARWTAGTAARPRASGNPSSRPGSRIAPSGWRTSGETDVVNPWLSNGRNDFRSLDRIVARAIEPGMTDAEKARALWWQEVQHRFHLEGDNDELLDPVKVFNVYGYNTCGNDSICLAGQWRKAGLKVAPARLVGHCVTQVFYDGSWHLMDGDMHSIYLLRDNETVAGEQDLVRDHDLIRRTHTQGILQPDRRAGDEWESSIYVFEGKVTGDRNSAEHRHEHDAASGRGARLALGAPGPDQVSRAPAAPGSPTGSAMGCGNTAPTSSSRPGARAPPPSSRSGRETTGSMAEEGKTGVVVWTMSQPLRLRRGKAGGRGDRREVQALLGRQVLARGRSQSRRALPARGARSVPVLPEMRALGRRTPPAARDRQRPPDGPAHASRHGRRHEHVHLHRRVGERTPGADHPPVGRAVREPTARGAGRTDLSARRRSDRGDRDRLPVAARQPIPTATRSPTTTSSSPRAPT